MADLTAPDHLIPSPDAPNLTHKQRLLVHYFMDVTLPTYRRIKASVRAAGYSMNQDIYSLFYQEDVQAEIERIEKERAESGRDMAQHLWDARYQAVRVLLEQMNEGADLRLIDPEQAFGKDLEKLGNAEKNVRANTINNHNRNVLQARRQSREAAEKVLAYTLGEPEQVVRHKRDENPSEKALARLSDEDLLALGEKVRGLLDGREGDDRGSAANPPAIPVESTAE